MVSMRDVANKQQKDVEEKEKKAANNIDIDPQEPSGRSEKVVMNRKDVEQLMYDYEQTKKDLASVVMSKGKLEQLKQEAQNEQVQEEGSRFGIVNFANPVTRYFYANLIFLSVVMVIITLLSMQLVNTDAVRYLNWRQIAIIGMFAWGIGSVMVWMDYRKHTMLFEGLATTEYEEEE